MTTAQLGQEPMDLTAPADDDLTLWSVTTILNVMDKPGLMWWAAGMTADAAIDSQKTWQAMLEEQGRDEAWRWLRMAHKRRPKNQLSASDTGTIVHTICETYALTGTRPDEDYVQDLIYRAGGEFIDLDHETALVQRMVDQFEQWAQRFSPSYQATEVCVYNKTYGYAGTADGFLTIDGTRMLFDYKTSREPYDGQGKPKGPYPESAALQISAYRHAEMAAVWRPRRFEKQFRRYYCLSPDEQALAVPVPEVDTGLVIYITPEDCSAYPIRSDEPVYRSFLYCLEMSRWVNETSKSVMSEPLR